MEIRLYFQMLLRGWWIIVLSTLVAVTASLIISYMAVPQYEATARFIINPSSTNITNAEVVRSLDTLDRTSVVNTYLEVMNSQRIYTKSLATLGINPAEPSLENYTMSGVVLPSSSVLQLTVTGPNPNVAAEIANMIGNETISYTKGVNTVYTMEFLDAAIPSTIPISPLPLRDAGLALVLGLVVGAILAILSEQIRMPIESLRRRSLVDHTSSAFSHRHFQNRLQDAVVRSEDGDIGLGLIQLEGLAGLIETLPSILAQQLLREVTRRLRNELRGNDIVGRWNDLTFAVMLPSTPTSAAERTLDRIRIALSQPIVISQLKEYVQLMPYTAVAVSMPNEPVNSLISRAEEALTQSRHEMAVDALPEQN